MKPRQCVHYANELAGAKLVSSRACSSTLAWMGVSSRAHRRWLWRADANETCA
jgi:hypothetical protein